MDQYPDQKVDPSASPSTTPSRRALKIVVAVLTYRRPEGISKLLHSMTRQIEDPARPYELTLLVIDNDRAGSGQAAVSRFADTGKYTLKYVVESRQGIPIARNRAMDEAPAGTDLFCFLDDDEWPVDEWVDSLLAVRKATDADCLYGPVEPVYPENAPTYFIKARTFERTRRTDGERLNYAASNNVMFDYALFRSLHLQFDERMRFTGGTDYLFFNQANRRGVKIYWADAALVYDIVPASRMTWKWVLLRQYRLGNTLALGDVLDGGRKRQIFRLAYGLARCGLGLVMVPALLFSPRYGMRAVTHAIRGAGMVAGILGYRYQEYKPAENGSVS